MYIKLLVLLLCLYAASTAELVPSWKVLQEKLHEKVEEIFNNDRIGSYIKIKTGKFFRYRLPGSGYEVSNFFLIVVIFTSNFVSTMNTSHLFIKFLYSA